MAYINNDKRKKFSNNFNKTSNKSKTIYNTQEKIKLHIEVSIWDCFCNYALTDNSNVTKKSLFDLRHLLEIMDLSEYSESIEILWRISFIQCILKAKLDDNIYVYGLIKDFSLEECDSVYQSSIKKYFKKHKEEVHLNNDEVIFISEIISSKLKYSYLFKYSDELQDALDYLKSSDANSLKKVNTKFEKVIGSLYKDIVSSKAIERYSAMDFSLKDDISTFNAFTKTIKELNKPNNYIKSGIKKLNEMLNGGFQNGRVYLFLAVMKHFKSGLLLNICLWACKYNKNIILKDKTKVPCVLYLTMENSISETIERTFVYCENKNIKEYSAKDSIEIVRKELYTKTGINLEMKYRPPKSISTIDLNAMIDDLYNEGQECIMIVQDYTKKIRSSNYNSDIRFELGNIIEDFSTIAKNRNIPVITAGQINRNGLRIIETAEQSKKKNIGKELNGSDIGESTLMLENTDYAIIINKEQADPDTTDPDYLTFKLVASRAKEVKVNYFAHPFEDNNGIKLVEDVELSKSYSIDSIGNKLKEFDSTEFRKKKMNKNSIKTIKNGEIVELSNNSVKDINVIKKKKSNKKKKKTITKELEEEDEELEEL